MIISLMMIFNISLLKPSVTWGIFLALYVQSSEGHIVF